MSPAPPSRTAKAAPLVEKLRLLATELSAEAFADLSEAELDTMRTALTTVRDNLAALQPPKKASIA